jgi:AcrR family transcriptional regulator
MFVKRPKKNSANAGKKPRKDAPRPAGAAPDDPARRVPAQERSKQRVTRILDAAALEFAERGYEPTTMEGIAARAETSIGSIYQFFPNKLAVFHALAHTYTEKLRGLFDSVLTAGLATLPWRDVLDASIDAFAAFHASDPGFRAVWLSMHLTEEVVTEGEALNREFANRVAEWIELAVPNVPKQTRGLVAMMIVEVISAMLILSARRPDDADAIMAETKVLMRRYLQPYVEGESLAAETAHKRTRTV